MTKVHMSNFNDFQASIVDFIDSIVVLMTGDNANDDQESSSHRNGNATVDVDIQAWRCQYILSMTILTMQPKDRDERRASAWYVDKMEWLTFIPILMAIYLLEKVKGHFALIAFLLCWETNAQFLTSDG